MNSKRRSGAVLLYGLLYLALTTGVAYLIHQKHAAKPRPAVESLKKLASVRTQRNGKVHFVDLFANRKVEKAMPYVAKIPEIEVLILSGTNISDEDLKAIEGLADLHTLTLNDTAVTAKGIEHVKGLKNLKILNLDDCPQIDDAAMAHLKDLKSLEKIHMNHTKVTNDGVKSLLGLSKLKHVLAYDTGIDETGKEQLTTAIPKVNVIISEQ